jgi:hypothetical protein
LTIPFFNRNLKTFVGKVQMGFSHGGNTVVAIVGQESSIAMHCIALLQRRQIVLIAKAYPSFL